MYVKFSDVEVRIFCKHLVNIVAADTLGAYIMKLSPAINYTRWMILLWVNIKTASII